MILPLYEYTRTRTSPGPNTPSFLICKGSWLSCRTRKSVLETPEVPKLQVPHCLLLFHMSRPFCKTPPYWRLLLNQVLDVIVHSPVSMGRQASDKDVDTGIDKHVASTGKRRKSSSGNPRERQISPSKSGQRSVGAPLRRRSSQPRAQMTNAKPSQARSYRIPKGIHAVPCAYKNGSRYVCMCANTYMHTYARTYTAFTAKDFTK